MQSYPIFCFNTVSLREFVEFWSKVYGSPPVEKLYAERIDKEQFDADDVRQLYRWKNGTNLSQDKQSSVERQFVAKLDVINALKQAYDAKIFDEHFGSATGAVWKIFLRHIISPNQFPIFDQHVFRAHYFLVNGIVREVEESLEVIPYSKQERAKEELYANSYVPFARGLMQGDVPLKKIDECLMMFGKFLKSEFSRALLPSAKI
ncbi:MAG: hypothetical protein COV45_00010 [Deltaproteobacteria bacterium CG11_big_fil_rev_8_21_14_0_20_47_16]|nr:MAG: hypothetical protein COV45_00010 [Deltaproteobacteria bacterium CG11_big_fil_rev_8_21_14_0_20_47_16]